MHRDIKSENLFLTSSEDILLGDFGVARDVINTEIGATDLGTRNYMAPETLDDDKMSTKKSDVWSFGCTVFELAIAGHMVGESAEQQSVDLFKPAAQGYVLLEQEEGKWKFRISNAPIDTNLKNLILSALTNNPSERPTMHQLILKYLKSEAEDFLSTEQRAI